ncbi:hypothetical protein BJY21_003682 [Kineosphaera limosa]|uniref:Putative transporter n=1 Tax=Kineosphaera limosa NBRC 100340 TaxID=1184609 RepID=K6WV46_9MICO|nr:TAXI family TRAP transporter solute-binding subunit [Kineosphaera limosa]NYE02498.1 hypothetical protein [Kineosphaera limosa]GAB95977.1 putative transporter [Kineosphaera limosa NBRC 100340]
MARVNLGQRAGRRRWLPAALLVVLALVAAGAWGVLHRPAPAPAPLTVATGLPGGVYYAFGQALQEATPDSATPLTARSSAASVENLRLVAAGEVDAGFTLADVAALAVAGQAPFDEPLPVQAVARLYDNHTHLVVLDASRVTDLRDLAGARVSLGADGSGTEMIAERLLTQASLVPGADVQVVRLDLTESVAQLQAGTIDAFFWSGGLPTEALSRLAATGSMRLIDLGEWVGPLTSAYGDHFSELPIPAGTYPGVEGVRTVGVPSLLVVHADLPVPVGQALTATLFHTRAAVGREVPAALQLSQRSAIATGSVPLHPGARRYYQEVKIANDPAG